MTDIELIPLACTVFYSFLRIHCALPQGAPRLLSVVLLRDGEEVSHERQRHQIIRPTSTVLGQFDLQAMIERDDFPDHYAVQLGLRGSAVTIPCRDIVDRERDRYAATVMTEFRSRVAGWLEANPGARPRMLDIGGRARSGNNHSAEFTALCDVTVADILADPSVDVVTDVHRMSEDLGENQFDFALCVSVFEHLLMPWKAALEVNKVLKPDGLIVVQTHQTVGMHDTPWDYYRFSDESWKGLFNSRTGFTIETTLLSGFQHIIPMHHYAIYPNFENAGGFNDSAVIARKTGVGTVDWPVTLDEIVSNMYPA